MIGRRLRHYRILDTIGGGGMGVVYKAHDESLDRPVAIKLLSAARLDDPQAKQRFRQEAQTASRLVHPNICTIHELGEIEDGTPYIVMTYYEGKDLAQRLREGPLPVRTALHVVRQIAAGLDCAHEAGIVHRDVKPANVMLTRGDEVKLLDFGVAKLFHGGGETQPGLVHGTLAYMSPEQACGRPVDPRTDVWSVGVVLHHALAGRLPFPDDNAGALLRAILDDPPAPLPAEVVAEAPLLAVIVRRALTKDLAGRYPSLAALSADLARIDRAAESTGITTVVETPAFAHQAVLVAPFANRSPNAESEYLVDGLTDEVITGLSKVRALRIISHASARRLKDSETDPLEVARELGVQYVLSGSVHRAGDALRVSAQLVATDSHALVWAERYGGAVGDVFVIQESIARQIVRALELELTAEEEAELAERPIDDFEAFDCYLRAKQQLLRYSADGLERALDLLGRAMERTGDNVLLLSALGQVHWQYANAGISTDPVHLHEAERCARQIVQLDPRSPHGLRLLGLLCMHEGEPQEAVRLLKQALREDPSDADTMSWLVSCYGLVGKPHAASRLVARVLEIEPLTPVYQVLPGVLALMAGLFDRAVPPMAQSYKMDPTNQGVGFVYAQALAMKGAVDEACERFEALRREDPESLFGRLATCYGHALRGDREAALAAVTPELERAAANDLEYAWSLAQCLALVDERARALDWLERAVGRGFINYPLLARLDPFLEELRGDDRFERLLADVRRRWEAFEV